MLGAIGRRKPQLVARAVQRIQLPKDQWIRAGGEPFKILVGFSSHHWIEAARSGTGFVGRQFSVDEACEVGSMTGVCELQWPDFGYRRTILGKRD